MKSSETYQPFFTTPTHDKRIEQMVVGAALFKEWWQNILTNDLSSWFNSYKSDLEIISKDFVDNGMGNIARRLRILSDAEMPAAEWKDYISSEMSIVFLICNAIIHHEALPREMAEEVFHHAGLNIFKAELEKRSSIEKKLLCISQESGRDESIVWRRNTFLEEDTGNFHYTYETAFKFFERNEKPFVGETFKTELVYFPGCNFGGGRIHLLNQQVFDDHKFNPKVYLNSFELWSKARAQIISMRPWISTFLLLVNGIHLRRVDGELYLAKAKIGKKITLPLSSPFRAEDFNLLTNPSSELNFIIEENNESIILKGAIESGALTLF